jgi:hypothetical protein
LAEEAILSKAAERIAEAIHRYARKKGWPSSDYHIFMVVKTTIYTLRVSVYCSAFQGKSEDELQAIYDDISDEIEKQFPQRQRPFNYVGLILTDDKQWAMDRSEAQSPAEFEVDERLINAGVDWREPFGQRSR